MGVGVGVVGVAVVGIVVGAIVAPGLVGVDVVGASVGEAVGVDVVGAAVCTVVGVDVGDGELARVATSLNSMTERLADTDRRQREFLADVAHELRTPITAIDGFVVPGRAFDASGRRLGRGGGYYDRALALARPEAWTVGVGYACQHQQALPHDPWDRSVGLLLDERGARAPQRD